MATFAERIYQLGSDALAEQERQVAELRSRGSTLVAAGGVIASLLAPSVLRGGGPNGLGESVATGIGLVGCAGLLASVIVLLRPYELGFSLRPGATYRALWDEGILDQPAVDLALADALEERLKRNGDAVERLAQWLGRALACMVVETLVLPEPWR